MRASTSRIIALATRRPSAACRRPWCCRPTEARLRRPALASTRSLTWLAQWSKTGLHHSPTGSKISTPRSGPCTTTCAEHCSLASSRPSTARMTSIGGSRRSPLRSCSSTPATGDTPFPQGLGFTADVSSAALTGFTTTQYRADWRTDSLGYAAPRTAMLSAAGPVFYFSQRGTDELGETISNSTLTSGGESRSFFVDTDALRYARTATIGLISEERFEGARTSYFEVSDPIATFAPAPIPEPETWALMLLGLGITVRAVRRRPHRASHRTSTVAALQTLVAPARPSPYR